PGETGDRGHRIGTEYLNHLRTTGRRDVSLQIRENFPPEVVEAKEPGSTRPSALLEKSEQRVGERSRHAHGSPHGVADPADLIDVAPVEWNLHGRTVRGGDGPVRNQA